MVLVHAWGTRDYMKYVHKDPSFKSKHFPNPMLNSEIKEAVVSKIMCLLVCQVVRRYLENVLV